MTASARRGVVVGAWGVAVLAGLVALTAHASQPGAQRPAPAAWPAASRLAPPAGRPTLLAFLHPRCPCSEATAGELARLVARRGAGRAVAVLVAPPGAPPGWAEEGVAATVRRIPGLEVVVDTDGVEAACFGALTSGQVVVYDAAGGLAFRGGITPGRGHAGDSAGGAAALNALTACGRADAPAPVFGCPLVEEDAP